MIRVATLEDFEKVKSLVPGLIRDSDYGFLFKDYVLTRSMFDPYIEFPLDKFCVIAEDEGKAIGFAMFERIPWRLGETEVSLSKITYYYIEPEYRKKGLMKQFVHWFELWSERIAAHPTLNKKRRGYKKIETIYMKEIK